MPFPLVAGTVGEPTDVHAGMVAKRVRVSTVAAGTLATSFENGDTVDGVTLATGDRILIKDQASGADNGIYTVNASGAPTRALDFDESAETLPGTLVVVSEGTSNKDSVWQLTTNATITVGSTALVFFPIHLQGTGSPESAVTAPVGATYRRTDGSTATTFYVKESGTGNTGWAAVGASSPSLTVADGVITVDVTLTTNSTIDVFSTDSLATGTWLVSMQTTILSASAGSWLAIQAVVGTATATFDGPRSATSGLSTVNSRCALNITFTATVTGAGTLKLQATSQNNAGTAEAAGVFMGTLRPTGYTAVKIA